MKPYSGQKNQRRFHVGDTWHNHTVDTVDVIGAAVADVAIRPTLLQHGRHQVLAYYDELRRLTLADRNILGLNWHFQKFDSKVQWDSHNYIDLGFDLSGRLHVAGNMHASPLQYWIVDLHSSSRSPLRLESLVNPSREQRVTYPRFLRDNDGQLLFAYRDGVSGDGDFICLRWDDRAARFDLVSDYPIIEGQGGRNAYIDTNAPILGPDGAWHLLWVWRDSPDAESTHSVNYARSGDLMSWTDAFGSSLRHPIVDEASATVDPVPPGQGLINNNVRLAFLPNERPVAIYHKRDASGSQQIWGAAFDGTRWARRQLTEWNYRWDFAGQGSLDFQIEIGLPETTADGVTVDVRCGEEVKALCVTEDLSVTSLTSVSPWNPIRRFQRGDGLYERVTPGRGWAPADSSDEWFVSHSSVLEQRDRPPAEPAPRPQPLAVIGVRASNCVSTEP